MPPGKDPDDFIRENGKDGLNNLLQEKQIIQSFIWNHQLKKIDQTNPYEISKFEKEIKKLSYSIQDETLKKYVLENFLERIKKLTPIQTAGQNNNYYPFKKKKDYKILKETKLLHQKTKDLSKIQIIEFSILFIILNNLNTASKKINELSNLDFISEKNDNFKNFILKSLSEGSDKDHLNSKIEVDFESIIKEINENSNIRIITKHKSDQEISDLLDELIQDHEDQCNLKKIESLEKKLINDLDENSYSELLKLKNQLNRE